MSSSRGSPKSVSFCSNISTSFPDSVVIDDDDDSTTIATPELESDEQQDVSPRTLFSGRWIEVAREESSSDSSRGLDVVEVKDHSPLSTLSSESKTSESDSLDNAAGISRADLKGLRRRLLLRDESTRGEEDNRPCSCSRDESQLCRQPPNTGNYGNRRRSSGLPLSSVELSTQDPSLASPLSRTSHVQLTDSVLGQDNKHSIKMLQQTNHDILLPMSRRGRMWTRLVDILRALTALLGYIVIVAGDWLRGEGVVNQTMTVKFFGAFALCCLASTTTRTCTRERRRRTGWTRTFEILYSRKTFLLFVYLAAWTQLVNAVANLWNVRYETVIMHYGEKEEEAWSGSHCSPSTVLQNLHSRNAISFLDDDENSETTVHGIDIESIAKETYYRPEYHVKGMKFVKQEMRVNRESTTDNEGETCQVQINPVTSVNDVGLFEPKPLPSKMYDSEPSTDKVTTRNSDDVRAFAFELHGDDTALVTRGVSESQVCTATDFQCIDYTLAPECCDASEPLNSLMLADPIGNLARRDEAVVVLCNAEAHLKEAIFAEVVDYGEAAADRLTSALESHRIPFLAGDQDDLGVFGPVSLQVFERQVAVIAGEDFEIQATGSSKDAIGAQQNNEAVSHAWHQWRFEAICGQQVFSENGLEATGAVAACTSEVTESELPIAPTETIAAVADISASVSHEVDQENAASAAFPIICQEHQSSSVPSLRLSRRPFISASHTTDPVASDKQQLCFERKMFFPMFDDRELSAWGSRLNGENESAFHKTAMLSRRTRQVVAFLMKCGGEHRGSVMLDSLFEVWMGQFWS